MIIIANITDALNIHTRDKKKKKSPSTDLVSDRIEVREQTIKRKKMKKKRLLKKMKNVDVRMNLIL